MKNLILGIALLPLMIVSARSFGQTRMSYAKHVEMSEIQIPGYTKGYTDLTDTTKKNDNTSLKFSRNEKLSNNFEVEMWVKFGGISSVNSAKGAPSVYKTKHHSGLLRPVGAKDQPNTIDSVWTVTIAGKTVIMNYFYCFFKDAGGEYRTVVAMFALYDDGFDNVTARIRPSFVKESGLTSFTDEAVFKARLTTVAELAAEVEKAMAAFLPKL